MHEERPPSEREVLERMAALLGVRFVDLRNFNVCRCAVNAVPPRLAIRHKVLPILRAEGVLTVALPTPPTRLPSTIKVSEAPLAPTATRGGVASAPMVL